MDAIGAQTREQVIGGRIISRRSRGLPHGDILDLTGLVGRVDERGQP